MSTDPRRARERIAEQVLDGLRRADLGAPRAHAAAPAWAAANVPEDGALAAAEALEVDALERALASATLALVPPEPLDPALADRLEALGCAWLAARARPRP